MRPFFMIGLGATQYKPSEVMGQSIDGETQFSGTLGAGVKAYVNEKVGFNFSGRWTPTYVKSDAAGVYCSPYWTPYYPGGCAVLTNPDYSNQFELSGGIILRL
jgi:opacity protein-like surface antigen